MESTSDSGTINQHHDDDIAKKSSPLNHTPSVDSTSEHRASQKKSSAQHPIQRQIRFVRTDGIPHLKKRRVAAACITCRKRKTRCSGEKPTCETCRQANQQCGGYKEKSSRPGIGQKIGYQSTGQSGSLTSADSENHHCPPGEVSQRPQSGENTYVSPQNAITHNVLRIDDLPIPDTNEWGKVTAADTKRHRRLPSEVAEAPAIQGNGRQATRNGDGLANRVPFFRYFGRTAIVPGYKKVVVEVRSSQPPRRPETPSSASMSPHSNSGLNRTMTLSPAPERLDNMPVYDPHDKNTIDPLIIHLVQTFFLFCGCSFPFLHHEQFVEDVKHKRVPAILVDAVCAIGTRFSDNPILRSWSRTDAGTVYANRTKALVIESFSHPNLSATQALLLMAYFEFGQSKDSGLWNFTGTAIRFAVDLGINRLEGMRGERRRRRRDARLQAGLTSPEESGDEEGPGNLYDQECHDATNTFWAIYFLDRAISIGTGRTVTIREDEIEIPMPPLEVRRDGDSELYPCPFAALIRIMSLYGSAADTINSIQKGASPSPSAIDQLIGLQHQINATFHSFPPRLVFTIQNFEYYVQNHQSSVFLLLHIWFHALVILLHGGVSGVPQLHSKDSRQIALMSAKTIVDILKYASDREKRAITANPFTSQPIYIAAKVFLESVSASGFQRCYKAIQDIDTYWSGVHYILNVLDQMANGVDDPLLYLEKEEVDQEMPPDHDPTKGWSAAGFAGETHLDVTWINGQWDGGGTDVVDDFLAMTQNEMVDVGDWRYSLGFMPSPGNWEDESIQV